jgi:nucleolar GTP-binding protein
MNFQKIPPVESGETFLDLAFSKARVQGKQKNLKGNWLQIIRKKEGLKLDIIKDNLVARLEKITMTFPNTKILPSFYLTLMDLTLDYSQFKKSLGAVGWAVKKVRFFHKSYVSRVVTEKDRQKVKELTKQFYGRISSVIKQINSNLEYLEICRKIMRSYPDVKEMFSVCLYGFPNVGKTTLLNKLTGTNAEVAAYAFTTKSINSGSFKIGDNEVQVLDVPGTLARKDKMNNIELQAELVLAELADLVVFVFDLSEQSGFSISNQKQLLQKVNQQLGKDNVLVYFSKLDLTTSEVANEFKLKHKHYSLEELKEKISAEYILPVKNESKSVDDDHDDYED